MYGFACMYVCAPHTCLVPMEARIRASEALELELQMIVSYRMGAENQILDLWKSNWCF